jgi:tRNA (cmo5U34)-methyltransferase
MTVDMTNVHPWQLNYDRYTTDKYDRDIVNSVPFHHELHDRIAGFIQNKYDQEKPYSVLDLGVGTGITAKLVRDLLPNAEIDAVDFSKQMLDGARKKLGKKNVRSILGDYTKLKLEKRYDLVVSVISIHHQNNRDKQRLFRKIFSWLNHEGIFIFGDLVTYKKPLDVVLNNALHYHHLVEHSTDQKTLAEWAHHQMFLNDPAPIEDQIDWLKKTGFTVKKEFLKWNTALLICKKR